MDTEASPPATRAARITRRAFLAVASAVAVAPLLPTGESAVLGAAPGRPVPAAHDGDPRAPDGSDLAMASLPLSVGYIRGSAYWPTLHAPPWDRDGVLGASDVIPAASLRSGDPLLLGRTAIVTVHGLHRTPDRTAGASLRHVTLDMDYRADDPAAVATFHAWTLRTGPAASVSGRSILRIDITTATRIGFDLSIWRRTSRTIATAHLGTGREQGLAKLRRGAYLLALQPGTWDAARTLPAIDDPEWGAIASLVVTVHHP
jgi:hypothetical protein